MSIPTFCLATLLNWVLDSACALILLTTHHSMTFSDLAHFRSFWTLSLLFNWQLNACLNSFRLTTASNPRWDSHKNALVYDLCSDSFYSSHYQLCTSGSYSSTKGAWSARQCGKCGWGWGCHIAKAVGLRLAAMGWLVGKRGGPDDCANDLAATRLGPFQAL